MTERPSRTSFVSWVLLGLVAMPVLYVLSAGPIIYNMVRTDAGRVEWVETYFAPLEWAYHHGLSKPLDAYAKFWIKLAKP